MMPFPTTRASEARVVDTMKTRQRATYVYYAVLCVVSAHFAIAYTKVLAPAFSYADYAAGLVGGPFQTRILMALVFRAALQLRILTVVGSHLPSPYKDPLLLFMVPVIAVALLVATEATRNAAVRIAGQNDVTRWGAFLVPLMAYFHYVIVPEVRVQTPYDVVQVALFAVGLGAALRRKRLLFYAVLLIGTLNRETALFLIPIFGILEWEFLQRTDGKRYLGLGCELAAQFALWALLRRFSAHFFSSHPTYLTVNWRQNLGFMANPMHWPTLASVFAFLWVLFLFQFRSVKHRGLRWVAWLFIPWFAGMFIVGDLLEIRIHSEWISYMALCCILIIANLAGGPGVSISANPDGAAEQSEYLNCQGAAQRLEQGGPPHRPHHWYCA
jgi:hypothetical protein